MPTIKTVNPFTGALVRTWELMDLAAIKELTSKSRKVFLDWKNIPAQDRAQLVRNSLSYFEENRETIAHDITTQMGRPLVQARKEIDGLLERGRYLCDIAPAILAPEKLPGHEYFQREILHTPHGVVLIIAAWNYPLLVAASGVFAALLAGNTVLLKHSSRVLSIGEHFQRAFTQIDAHPGLIQPLVIDHAITAQLIEEGEVQHVAFTGSVGGGKQIYASAAKCLIDCNLELGGKDSAYVAPDADIKQSAELLVDGAVYNCGQCCCGIERVYVHVDVVEPFLAECQGLMEDYVLGDPLDANTTLGPLAVADSATLMETQISEATTHGASILFGGNMRNIGQGTFFEPTLLTVNDNKLAIMQEENFGPILPVMKVLNDEEAIAHINDSKYGLTTVICTSSIDRAERFANATNVGTVYMNRCDYLDPALPWTGVKASGKGSSLSQYGLLAMTHPKSKHFRTHF